MNHIVSEANSASVSRHLNRWTPQIDLFSVTGHPKSVNLLRYASQNSGVKNFKYVGSGFCVMSAVCSVLRSWLFLQFLTCNWSCFESSCQFLIFNSHFLVTTLGQDLFLGTYFKNKSLYLFSKRTQLLQHYVFIIYYMFQPLLSNIRQILQ